MFAAAQGQNLLTEPLIERCLMRRHWNPQDQSLHSFPFSFDYPKSSLIFKLQTHFHSKSHFSAFLSLFHHPAPSTPSCTSLSLCFSYLFIALRPALSLMLLWCYSRKICININQPAPLCIPTCLLQFFVVFFFERERDKILYSPFSIFPGYIVISSFSTMFCMRADDTGWRRACTRACVVRRLRRDLQFL